MIFIKEELAVFRHIGQVGVAVADRISVVRQTARAPPERHPRPSDTGPRELEVGHHLAQAQVNTVHARIR
jgi:hypothetical protein